MAPQHMEKLLHNACPKPFQIWTCADLHTSSTSSCHIKLPWEISHSAAHKTMMREWREGRDLEQHASCKAGLPSGLLPLSPAHPLMRAR